MSEPQMPKGSVLIGLLSHHGEFNPAMTRSLDALIAHSHSQGVALKVHRAYGSIIPKNRNLTFKAAIKYGASYVLFIDSDMVFDPDALVRLLKHDRDIVSGLAVMRMPPYTPVARMLKKNGRYEARKNLNEGRFYSDLDGVGAAFLLVRVDAIRDMPQPWFAMPAYGEDVIGEDYYFCGKAKAANLDLCVDTSVVVGHIGEHVYTINDYMNYRAEREKQEAEKKDA